MALSGAVIVGLLSLACAHGHEGGMAMDVGHSAQAPSLSNATVPATYFQSREHSGLLMAHIVFMTIGWVFVLPIGR